MEIKITKKELNLVLCSMAYVLSFNEEIKGDLKKELEVLYTQLIEDYKYN